MRSTEKARYCRITSASHVLDRVHGVGLEGGLKKKKGNIRLMYCTGKRSSLDGPSLALS